ncbi:hypothetical protein P280DRAFT_208075 [Massarina eburnea CBS 473.64]|uniref:Uncharacterized protein n=1 Tax=Massarina eburnea CBS 473.64 TaxID=1395130 RepID=A0A6A6RHX3_9PLEO|nr:hypothetical protein P280DRAFT_208075 [Massarina eburnea CBS 473.64]
MRSTFWVILGSCLFDRVTCCFLRRSIYPGTLFTHFTIFIYLRHDILTTYPFERSNILGTTWTWRKLARWRNEGTRKLARWRKDLSFFPTSRVNTSTLWG